MIKGISTQDVLVLAVGLAGFLSRFVGQNKTAKKWMAKIGGQTTVERAISTAAAFASDTPEKRRQHAVDYLKKVSSENYGIPLPTSVANLLVETVYQVWKSKTGK